MTKPADERSDFELRQMLKKFTEWATSDAGRLATADARQKTQHLSNPVPWHPIVCAAFALSERSSAIKEAAKAMCNCCRDTDVWKDPVREPTGRWTHWAKPGTGYVSYRCEAEPIQELLHIAANGKHSIKEWRSGGKNF